MAEGLANHRGFPLSKEELQKISLFHRLMRSPLGAVLFGLTAFVILPLPLVYLAGSAVVLTRLRILTPKAMHSFYAWGCGCWLHIMSFLFDSMLGIRTRMFGHSGRFKKKSVILMNHISHFDWMYFWGVERRIGDFSIWRVVMKASLKNVPIVGPCMQLLVLLFVSRKWEKDNIEFEEKLNHYKEYPVQLLLFPEGGDITPKSKAKSDLFADEKGLTHYDFCLHPRTTGFLNIVKSLRDEGLETIYDITIGYPDMLSKTEPDFVMGRMPREIHFYIQCYEIKDLPRGDEELAEWCKARWREKEERLRHFYTHREFLEKEPAGVEGSKEANGTSCYRRSPEFFGKVEYRPLIVGVLAFAILNALILYLVLASWICVFWGIGVAIYMAHAIIKGKGLDYLVMDLTKKFAAQTKPGKVE